ncbi:MAG: type II secretion system protein GspE, partial [Planctomycetota bacterium]
MSAQAEQLEAASAPEALEAVAAFDPEAFLSALVEGGELTEQDAALALEVARQSGVTPVRALLDLGVAGEEQVASALAAALGAPLLELEPETAQVSEQLPSAYQRAAGMALVVDAEGELTLVVTDPSLKAQLRAAAQALGKRSVRLAVARVSAVEALHEARERSGGEDAAVEARAVASVESEVAALRELASEAPVIRFFNQIIERALALGASDVHLERYDRVCSLRMRVDGLLVEQPPPPESLFEALLCRVKILAGLDVAKRRVAQDGRIRMRLRGGVVDLRVSLVPTLYGQDAAIRLQDAKALERVEL